MRGSGSLKGGLQDASHRCRKEGGALSRRLVAVFTKKRSKQGFIGLFIPNLCKEFA